MTGAAQPSRVTSFGAASRCHPPRRRPGPAPPAMPNGIAGSNSRLVVPKGPGPTAATASVAHSTPRTALRTTDGAATGSAATPGLSAAMESAARGPITIAATGGASSQATTSTALVVSRATASATPPPWGGGRAAKDWTPIRRRAGMRSGAYRSLGGPSTALRPAPARSSVTGANADEWVGPIRVLPRPDPAALRSDAAGAPGAEAGAAPEAVPCSGLDSDAAIDHSAAVRSGRCPRRGARRRVRVGRRPTSAAGEAGGRGGGRRWRPLPERAGDRG